jgi:putative copper resistance protein D
MGAGTLVGARLLQYSGALVLFGTPLFYLYGFRRGAPSTAAGQWAWQRPLILVATSVALLGALIWVMAETVSMSGETSDAINPTALWTVVSETRFGRACCARIALLMLSVIACLAITRAKVRWIVQAILGSAVTVSFAWTGHGAIEIVKTGGIHLGGDLLHLLAAGIWIGALVPLIFLALLAKHSRAMEDALALQFALDRFSAIGIWIVAALVLSGILNSWFLIGPSHWRATFTTTYGIVLIVKLGLFGMMLVFAALNRYRLSPALGAAIDRESSTQLPLYAVRSSIFTETALALLVLGAVSLLGTLEPPSSSQ